LGDRNPPPKAKKRKKTMYRILGRKIFENAWEQGGKFLLPKKPRGKSNSFASKEGHY